MKAHMLSSSWRYWGAFSYVWRRKRPQSQKPTKRCSLVRYRCGRVVRRVLSNLSMDLWYGLTQLFLFIMSPSIPINETREECLLDGLEFGLLFSGRRRRSDISFSRHSLNARVAHSRHPQDLLVYQEITQEHS